MTLVSHEPPSLQWRAQPDTQSTTDRNTLTFLTLASCLVAKASFHICVSYENQKLPLLELCDDDVQRLTSLYLGFKRRPTTCACESHEKIWLWTGGPTQCWIIKWATTRGRHVDLCPEIQEWESMGGRRGVDVVWRNENVRINVASTVACF